MDAYSPIQKNDKFTCSLSSINDRLEQKIKEFFIREKHDKIQGDRGQEKGKRLRS